MVFSKVSCSIKSGIFSSGGFQNFIGFKLAHGFGSKSFVLNLLRFLKSASRFSVKVLASKRFHFVVVELVETQSPFFMACALFGKVRFLKSATFF